MQLTIAPIPCGMPLAKPRGTHIYEGVPAFHRSFPWVLYLELGVSACGAVLVPACGHQMADVDKSDIALTAAHCVVEWDPVKRQTVPRSKDNMYVYAGTVHRPGFGKHQGAQFSRIEAFKFHQSFNVGVKNPPQCSDDLALLKLQRPMVYSSTVRHVCLPSKARSEVPTGKGCFTAGWGLRKFL